MIVQNPDTKDKTEDQIKTEETEHEQKVLNTVRDLNSGTLTFNDINDEKLEAEIHDRFVAGGEEFTETDEKTVIDEKEPEPTIEKPVVTDEIVDTDKQEFLKNRKAGLDELNTINQKIEAANNRLGETEKLSQKPEVKKFEDVGSEEALTDTNSRLSKMEANQEEYFKSKTEDLKNDTLLLQNEKLYLELSNFQFENPELKTSKPVKVLNAQYRKFLSVLPGKDHAERMENADKFLKDKSYREQVEAGGARFPMADADYKAFDTISNINAFRNERKYPSLTSANHDFQMENGIVLDKVKIAALNAAEATVEKLGGNGGATTLSPDDGSGGGSDTAMSPDAMMKWLTDHPTPTTPQDIAKADAIHAAIFPEGGKS